MAPRGATKPADKRGPDGAPPGAEAPRTDADKHAFDADGRAKAREDAPVTIGEQVFHRRRKNWQVTRELRTLMRVQERAAGKAARLRARVSALTELIRGVQDPKTGGWVKQPISDDAEIDRLEAEVEQFEEQIDVAGDAADDAAYDMIALLLRKDGEGDEHPAVEFLKESLDSEDAGDLAANLAGGGEPAEDPTTPAASS